MKFYNFGGKYRYAGKGSEQLSPMNRAAKRAGLFYLIFILTTALATYLRSQLIVFGDAAATAQNIMANELLLRAASVTELISAVFFLLVAWALYSLLRPVNSDLALMFLLLNLGGVVVECINMLNLFAALPLLSGAEYLTVFSASQLQAHALMYIDLYSSGFMIAQIFYGAWLLPLGYLVYRSGFLPQWLGLLLIADFVGVLGWFLQFFLLPGLDALSYPSYLLGFIAEVSLTMWLLLKGVKEPPSAGVSP